MADIWMDVDTALAEVPVNILPLLDATDFKTIEDAVTYNAAGLALYWHFVTTGGAYTVTAVTPTTAGAYDWTDQGAAGVYTIEIPASGGASINNDTEGFGWFTGVATGVLPWRGPTIGFRAAALNDALIDGGDLLDVSVTQWLGTAAATPTVAGVPEVDITHIGGTAATAAAGIPEVKVASVAANALTASALATDAVTEIRDGIFTGQMTESYNTDGTAPTLAQAVFLILQMLTEKSISSTTLTVKKLDGTTSAATFTLDSATTPTSITRAT